MPVCLTSRPLWDGTRGNRIVCSYTEAICWILLFRIIHQSHVLLYAGFSSFYLPSGSPMTSLCYFSPSTCTRSSSYCCPISPLVTFLFALGIQNFIEIPSLKNVLYSSSWILWVYNFRIVTFHLTEVFGGKENRHAERIDRLAVIIKDYLFFSLLDESSENIKSSNLLFTIVEAIFLICLSKKIIVLLRTF